MSKRWVNTTAKDVVTISDSIWNDNTRTVANIEGRAVNYNAQILNRIAELEKAINSGGEERNEIN